jgi:hypothetical protein
MHALMLFRIDIGSLCVRYLSCHWSIFFFCRPLIGGWKQFRQNAQVTGGFLKQFYFSVIGGFYNFFVWQWTDIATVFYNKNVDTRDRVRFSLYIQFF